VPQSRGLHHLDLVVSDLKRSREFYSDLLRPLGWGPVLDLLGERGEEIWYLQARDTWLGLREKQSDAHATPYDRYAVGVHHVAFEALSREAVDGAWQRVLAQGVATESGPKEFPHYAPGYYAAFFYDPDGIKLEVVYEPTRLERPRDSVPLRKPGRFMAHRGHREGQPSELHGRGPARGRRAAVRAFLREARRDRGARGKGIVRRDDGGRARQRRPVTIVLG
jgi:glyoxylase I family protein